MIPQNIQQQIISIWDKYISDNKIVFDTKSNDLHDIDSRRMEALETLKIIVQDFISGAIDIAESKTYIGSFYKQNDPWSFTFIKGQMFLIYW